MKIFFLSLAFLLVNKERFHTCTKLYYLARGHRIFRLVMAQCRFSVGTGFCRLLFLTQSGFRFQLSKISVQNVGTRWKLLLCICVQLKVLIIVPFPQLLFHRFFSWMVASNLGLASAMTTAADTSAQELPWLGFGFYCTHTDELLSQSTHAAILDCNNSV
jgi:hypothetical protein